MKFLLVSRLNFCSVLFVAIFFISSLSDVVTSASADILLKEGERSYKNCFDTYCHDEYQQSEVDLTRTMPNDSDNDVQVREVDLTNYFFKLKMTGQRPFVLYKTKNTIAAKKRGQLAMALKGTAHARALIRLLVSSTPLISPRLSKQKVTKFAY